MLPGATRILLERTATSPTRVIEMIWDDRNGALDIPTGKPPIFVESPCTRGFDIRVGSIIQTSGRHGIETKPGHSTMASSVGTLHGAASASHHVCPHMQPPGKTEETFSPDALLIGAAKSGTTSLADLLAQHPGICVSTPKESHYYSHNFKRGLAWYRRRFKNPSAPVTMDASPSYSKAPIRGPNLDPVLVGVPQRVFAANPDTRIIYIMRDPVARTWSNWKQRVNIGREARAFEDALEGEDMKLIDNGDYLAQIRLWQALFPIENFHFLTFEALLQNPLSAAADIFTFLGLPPAPGGLRLRHLNETIERSRIGRFVVPKVIRSNKMMALRALAPLNLRRRVNRALVTNSKPDRIISEAAIAKIHNALAPSWNELEALTGVCTAPWRKRQTAALWEKEATP